MRADDRGTNPPPNDPNPSVALEWTEIRDGNHRADGADKDAMYIIYRYRRGSSELWRCEYVPYPGAFNSVSEVDLSYDLDRCKESAQKDHHARVRRLAWKRYMRENDPPRA